MRKKNNVNNMTIDEIVAYNFKRFLAESDIKQKEYAEKHNIDPSVVSKWINGVRPMTMSEVKAAAETFGVTVNDFCYAGAERKKLEVKNSKYHPIMAQQTIETRLFEDEFSKPFNKIAIVLVSFVLTIVISLFLINKSPFWSLIILFGFVYLYNFLKKEFGTKKTFVINYVDEIFYYRNESKNKKFIPTLLMHIISVLVLIDLLFLYALFFEKSIDDLISINILIVLCAVVVNIFSFTGIYKNYDKIMYHNETSSYNMSLINLCSNLSVVGFSFTLIVTHFEKYWFVILISIIPLILAVFEFKYTCQNYEEYKLVYKKDNNKIEELFKNKNAE